MAAPYVPPVPPAPPGAFLRVAIARECLNALNQCRNNPVLGEGFEECINRKKAEIKEWAARFPAAGGVDVDGLVENFNWNPPAQGGKRKRRTRHRKRFHKKNRTRRNRMSV